MDTHRQNVMSSALPPLSSSLFHFRVITAFSFFLLLLLLLTVVAAISVVNLISILLLLPLVLSYTAFLGTCKKLWKRRSKKLQKAKDPTGLLNLRAQQIQL